MVHGKHHARSLPSVLQPPQPMHRQIKESRRFPPLVAKRRPKPDVEDRRNRPTARFRVRVHSRRSFVPRHPQQQECLEFLFVACEKRAAARRSRALRRRVRVRGGLGRQGFEVGCVRGRRRRRRSRVHRSGGRRGAGGGREVERDAVAAAAVGRVGAAAAAALVVCAGEHCFRSCV